MTERRQDNIHRLITPNAQVLRGRGIYLLPNLFTTAALFAGFYAMMSSTHHHFQAAAIGILAAIVLDGMDGRIARMTNTQSDFGAEYDSLADMVSFGVAPAVLAYEWMLRDVGKFGFLIAFVYVSGAALRLARFNVQKTVQDKRFFKGLPSPSAAALVATTVWFAQDYHLQGEAFAVVLTLSGCSAAYWPEFSQDETTEAAPEEAPVTNRAPVPVTETQIDRIVRDVARVAGAGDDALDAVALESRFRGDALAQRKANYQIRTSVPDYEVRLPRITDEQLDYELVQSTEGWPRTIFVTVASELPSTGAEEAAPAEGEEDAAAEPTPSPSLAMVLTQRNPHENFKVSRLFALRGGISMPPAAPVEEGTARLADDLKGLVLPPGEVGPAYAAILAGGPEVEQAELFDLEGDSVIAKSGAAWVATARQSATDAGTDVDYSVSAAQSDGTIVSLSTGVEGALVATTVRETRVEAQTGDYQPTAVGAFAALSGLTGRHERLVSVVAHQLLFFVPSEASGDSIQLLGYTTELVEANNS